MTPKEKYLKALVELMAAQQEVQADESNPFNLGMPDHVGLSGETFITHHDLENLKVVINEAIQDNEKFSRLWGVGRTLTNVVKAFI